METVWTLSEYLLTGLYIYSAIIVIFIVITENRNPVKALSWIMLMVFLPIVGVVIYIFVGQDFRRKKWVKRQRNTDSKSSYYAILPRLLDKVEISKRFLGTAQLLYDNSNSEVFPGNLLDVYISGESMFDSLFYEIANAESSIHVEFYIIENDEVGNRLKHLLIQKAQSGIPVRLIYDYLGGWHLPLSFKKELKDGGVEIRAFAPIDHIRGFSKINYRNHRKIVVVDGKIGYIGGMNIADRYSKGNKLGSWRDTFMRVEGSAVHGIQQAFLSDWKHITKEFIDTLDYYPVPIYLDNNFVQIVRSGPDRKWRTIMQGVVSILNKAQKYVYIHTPYLILNDSLQLALEMAALSGVDIRILVPEKSDTHLTAAASRSFFEPLMQAGVKIYYYRPNFLHSKAIVADDEISIVGTANMDVRSYEQNFEIAAFVYEQKTALSLRRYFEYDLQTAHLLTLDEWSKRSNWRKLGDSIAHLFSPLL